MDAAVQSLIKDHFDSIKATSFKLRNSTAGERKKKLRKLEKWILQNRSEIQNAVYQDLQKPSQETDITEIFVVLSEIRLACKKLKSWSSNRPVQSSLPFFGTIAYVHHEPKGACLIISPWNYPFQLAIAPLVSAIAAGNAVIIKPSEFSENTSRLIHKMCKEVFDKEEVAVVLGDKDESKELLQFPFDHIFFTGSPQVGKLVMEAAAKNLTSVTLELGGKSPTIVDQTANIKDAAKKIAWGKWQNAGQICIAPDYLFAHEEVYEELIDELSLQSDRIYGKKENYGGIISRSHHQRINDLMVDAIEKGANIGFGGKSDKKNLRFTPTLLTGISQNSRVLDEEIFGPILPILKFRKLDEVIDFINKKPKPLALYIFSKNKKNIDLIQRKTSSGMLTINDTVLQFGHPHLPIGGVNNSGIGKSHGHAGFLAFTNEKAVLKQPSSVTITKTIYPPYSRIKKFIIEMLVKYF